MAEDDVCVCVYIVDSRITTGLTHDNRNQLNMMESCPKFWRKYANFPRSTQKRRVALIGHEKR